MQCRCLALNRFVVLVLSFDRNLQTWGAMLKSMTFQKKLFHTASNYINFALLCYQKDSVYILSSWHLSILDCALHLLYLFFWHHSFLSQIKTYHTSNKTSMLENSVKHVINRLWWTAYCFFFVCRPTFFNDCKKIGQFGYIVWKYRPVDTLNIILGKITEMPQLKNPDSM